MVASWQLQLVARKKHPEPLSFLRYCTIPDQCRFRWFHWNAFVLLCICSSKICCGFSFGLEGPCTPKQLECKLILQRNLLRRSSALLSWWSSRSHFLWEETVWIIFPFHLLSCNSLGLSGCLIFAWFLPLHQTVASAYQTPASFHLRIVGLSQWKRCYKIIQCMLQALVFSQSGWNFQVSSAIVQQLSACHQEMSFD